MPSARGGASSPSAPDIVLVMVMAGVFILTQRTFIVIFSPRKRVVRPAPAGVFPRRLKSDF